MLLSTLAVACGGGSDQPASNGDPTSQPSTTVNETSTTTDEASDSGGACSLLSKEAVQSALGTDELAQVTDSTYDCAYGVEGEDAQVAFSSGTLAGTVDTYREDITRFQDTLGDDHVRVLSGVGQAAFIVDNGFGGGFFASALGESGKTINIYIYPLVNYDDAPSPTIEITNDQLYEACEELLAAAAPML